jgi:hypothetical protein
MSTSAYRQGRARAGRNSTLPATVKGWLSTNRLTGLSLLVLLALTVRLGLVFVLRSEQLEAQTYEHGEIARNIVEGRGFRVWFLGEEGLTSQQAPVYPYLLAGLYAVFGAGSPGALLAMQVFQCILGAGTAALLVWLSWLMTDRLPFGANTGRRLGWLAGLGMALYPTHVYAVTHIQVAVLATFLSLLVLALCCEAGRRASCRWACAAGLAAGLLVLTDPILALVAAIGAGVIAMGKKGLPSDLAAVVSTAMQKSKVAALYMAVGACVVLPWLVRNHRVHGEWVFVKSTFGYAFWQGNNARSWGTDKIPKTTAQAFLDNRGAGLRNWNAAMWEARHETLYIDDVLLKPFGYRQLRGMTEPQKSRYLMARACSDLRREPALYGRLCLQRLQYFLLFDATNPKTRNAVYRTAHLSLLVLSVVGLVCSWRYRRGLWPTYAVFACVTVFHTLTITSVRFHLPLEPLQLMWSAAAVDWVLQTLSAQTRGLRQHRSAAVAPKLATGHDCPALPV